MKIFSKTMALITLAACVVFAMSARAQDPVKKIGVLWSGAEKETGPYWGAFIQGMRALGWVDGKTAKFIMRFDYDDKAQLPKLATELVKLGVDVIGVTGVAAQVARNATTTIPIVVVDSADPIAEGLTATLSRPIGNVTGMSWQSTETAKALGLKIPETIVVRATRVVR